MDSRALAYFAEDGACRSDAPGDCAASANPEGGGYAAYVRHPQGSQGASARCSILSAQRSIIPVPAMSRISISTQGGTRCPLFSLFCTGSAARATTPTKRRRSSTHRGSRSTRSSWACTRPSTSSPSFNTSRNALRPGRRSRRRCGDCRGSCILGFCGKSRKI